MKNTGVCILVLLMAFCFCGCGGPKKPEGFPQTVPFTLTVTRDHAPLADAKVQLYPQKGIDAAIGGTTDMNGVVSLKTVRGSYSQLGSPAGTFKVTVKKKSVVPGELPEEEIHKLSPDEAAVYSQKIQKEQKKAVPEVAARFNQESTTPLSVTVTSGGKETIQVTAK